MTEPSMAGSLTFGRITPPTGTFSPVPEAERSNSGGRPARMRHLLRMWPQILEEVSALAQVLRNDPSSPGTARRLSAAYKTLRVASGELGLVQVSRVARAGEVFAQLVSTGAIAVVPRHFLMLNEIREGLARLQDRVTERWSDVTGSREASHILNVVLSSEPLVGSILLQRPVMPSKTAQSQPEPRVGCHPRGVTAPDRDGKPDRPRK
jgi:hypothetical protein